MDGISAVGNRSWKDRRIRKMVMLEGTLPTSRSFQLHRCPTDTEITICTLLNSLLFLFNIIALFNFMNKSEREIINIENEERR